MRREGHRNRLQAPLARSFHNAFEDFPMPEVKAVKVADAHDGRMPDAGSGQ
jgi:hypothetical protein